MERKEQLVTSFCDINTSTIKMLFVSKFIKILLKHNLFLSALINEYMEYTYRTYFTYINV